MTSVLLFVLIFLASCSGEKTESQESNTPVVEKKSLPDATQPENASTEEKPEGPIPVIIFAKTVHDFGTINEGDKVSYKYSFSNTGEAPLVVQSARPSCGCTVSAWSKDPIPVGGSGFVDVKFDSKGKPNVQNKTVTVTANTWPKTTVLHFKAVVTPKSESSK